MVKLFYIIATVLFIGWIGMVIFIVWFFSGTKHL